MICFYAAKTHYAVYAALNAIDAVGVCGSNPHAPTNSFNNLAQFSAFPVTPNYAISDSRNLTVSLVFAPTLLRCAQ
jgi:hypothetical protein